MTPRQFLRRLRRQRSGIAMTEFALGAPFILMAGLWGAELANFALVNMKVSQLAGQVADNTSRIGEGSSLEYLKIFEEDVNDLLLGAHIQGGKGLDLYARGRVIISSLEVWNEASHCYGNGNCPSGLKNNGVQFIHWQRCKGMLEHTSAYGKENSAQPNGIGPAGQEIYATAESPVILVEIMYEYKPLISSSFLGSTFISSSATFMVRDERDQHEVFKRNVSTPIADCALHDTFT